MSNLFLPNIAQHILQEGAICALGISGGKDSQALLSTFVHWYRAQQFPGRLFAIFADLGRAEWWQTRPFIEQLCSHLGVELVVVQRTQGDLLDRIEERQQQTAHARPFWPSSSTRYCTSDLKRSPIDKHLRSFDLVISLEGIRAAESEARAQKEAFTLRSSISAQRYRSCSTLHEAWQTWIQERQHTQQTLFEEAPVPTQLRSRFACSWYPLLSWTIDEVWQACGTTSRELEERRHLYQEGVRCQDEALRSRALTGWPAHPAYVLGANRLSCSLCVLGDEATLLAGAQHHPDYYRSLCLLEARSGWRFQPHRWLCDIAPDLLTEEIRSLLAQHPRRIQWLEMVQQKRRRRAVLPMRNEGTKHSCQNTWRADVVPSISEAR